jgi:membrane associated rhomboid family serine protease/Zn-finger nucleic acid-binding protein
MKVIPSGEVEIDRCALCGAQWFDFGEIGEVTEGRLDPADLDAPGEGAAERPSPSRSGTAPSGEGTASPPSPVAMSAPRGGGAGAAPPAAGESDSLPRRLASMRALARTLSCPRCSVPLGALDYQLTGVVVIVCPSCRGMLLPKASTVALSGRFRLYRENREAFARMGEALAEGVRRREGIRWAPQGKGSANVGSAPALRPSIPPIPLVAPLATTATGAAEEARRPNGGESFFPYVTVALALLLSVVHLGSRLGGCPASVLLPGGAEGLPAGGGFLSVPAAALPASLVLHGGLVPFLCTTLFLVVFGDDLEARVGPLPFLAFYFLWGIVAAAAHLAAGGPAGHLALGGWGAAAGMLGAYLVFFPNVQVTMLGWGEVRAVPAYLFAVAWLAVLFFFGPGARLHPAWAAVTAWLLPGQLSLQGNLAGFAAGALTAAAWRNREG